VHLGKFLRASTVQGIFRVCAGDLVLNAGVSFPSRHVGVLSDLRRRSPELLGLVSNLGAVLGLA